MRSVDSQAHETATNQPGNRNRHDPRKEQQTNSLPVDGLEGTVAETNTHRGARDAHGRRHGQGVLRKDENGDGGAQLHGRATAGRVVREFVAHD